MPDLKTLLGPSLVLCTLFTACGTSTRDDVSPTKWHCTGDQSHTACSCEQIAKGTVVLGSGEVSVCQDFSCCLHSPDEGTCECLDSANCAAEASSRPGAAVVDVCPPGATIPPVQCAKQGENCRYDYLQGHGFEGCCSGSVCRASSEGIPLCQPATDEETASAAQCSKFARGNEVQALKLTTPTLETSVGTIGLPPVMFAFLDVGPLGCVSKLRLVLSSTLDCRFEVEASVAGSELALTRITGDLQGCPGYTGSTNVLDGPLGLISLTDPEGSLTFSGAACDANLVFESYAVAGRFDFHLAAAESSGITLADQHLIVEGGIMGLEPTGECVATE